MIWQDQALLKFKKYIYFAHKSHLLAPKSKNASGELESVCTKICTAAQFVGTQSGKKNGMPSTGEVKRPVELTPKNIFQRLK